MPAAWHMPQPWHVPVHTCLTLSNSKGADLIRNHTPVVELSHITSKRVLQPPIRAGAPTASHRGVSCVDRRQHACYANLVVERNPNTLGHSFGTLWNWLLHIGSPQPTDP